LRPDLRLGAGYHSPQVPAEVRLNTNESPFAPPDEFVRALADEMTRVAFHRYPDRGAVELRRGIAELHGVDPAQVFCANGSNEVLQCLLLAYGGPGRRSLLFEPTYTLHAHISRLTGTEVVAAPRDEHFAIEPAAALAVLAATRPSVTFVCSPNNPTGVAERAEVVAALLGGAPGLVVVDEAYGQFAQTSALELREPGGSPGGTDARGLVVVRTFSKTWAMASVRLGYAIADPEVVTACEEVVLPYHLSVPTQVAGVVALRFAAAMASRTGFIAAERDRLAGALRALAVDTWPSEANFILFRPRDVPAGVVWQRLLDRSVLVRDCSTWAGVEGCLRVTVGTPEENDRFASALTESLR
jgi:histidinol-phosphate aminotransferase